MRRIILNSQDSRLFVFKPWFYTYNEKMDWFLYDIGLRHERVKQNRFEDHIFNHIAKTNLYLFVQYLTTSIKNYRSKSIEKQNLLVYFKIKTTWVGSSFIALHHCIYELLRIYSFDIYERKRFNERITFIYERITTSEAWGQIHWFSLWEATNSLIYSNYALQPLANNKSSRYWCCIKTLYCNKILAMAYCFFPKRNLNFILLLFLITLTLSWKG